MKPRSILAMVALLAGLAAPAIAQAQTVAYAAPGLTNMRAGPGTEYEVIARVRGGSAVIVYGCLQNFLWCDSSVESIRGWISTTRLEFEYAGNLVPLQPYYRYFNAPEVVFNFGYWDRHYRDRPFYHRRHRDRPPRTEGADFGYLGGSPDFEEDDVRAGRRYRQGADLDPNPPTQPWDSSGSGEVTIPDGPGGPCVPSPSTSCY